ncbi:MAG: SMI1/KNR4 family protein [Actinomycetaceae bacterium]|nr:SMI1/KNR4 family protein [Actinomycetaceae bacterium]
MTETLGNCASQIERIQRKLAVVRLVDHLREISGADSHDYVLGEPLSIEQIRHFEEEYEVTLPEAYVAFLTQIGHSGLSRPGRWVDSMSAGPKYGLYPLGSQAQIGELDDLSHIRKDALVGSISNEEWARTFGPLEEMDYSEDPESWDALWEKIHYGTLPVAYGGCSDFYGLILNGPQCGAIVDSHGEYEFPDGPPKTVGSDFLSWYEGWLDEILQGGVRRSRSRYSLKQKEIFSRLAENVDKGRIASSARMAGAIKRIKPKYVPSLWQWYREANDERTREYLLALLAQFDYENAKTEIQGACDGLLIHIFATRAPQHIGDWEDRLKEMESSGRQDLIDAVWLQRTYCGCD